MTSFGGDLAGIIEHGTYQGNAVSARVEHGASVVARYAANGDEREIAHNAAYMLESFQANDRL